MRLALIFLFATACATDGLHAVENRVEEAPPVEQPPPPDTCQTGGLVGYACPAGAPLVGATVSLWATDCAGNFEQHATASGANGQFALADVPAGGHRLSIEHPLLAEPITVEARVVPGQIVAVAGLDAAACLDAPPRLAVVEGEWDSVEVILDQLGLAYDVYLSSSPNGDDLASPALELLHDAERMADYDAILFNCGRLQRDFLAVSIDTSSGVTRVGFDYATLAYANLRAFVRGGGNIYASDWAYPIVEGLSPDAIDFAGDDGHAYDVLTGPNGSTAGEIADVPLSAFVGAGEVPVEFNLDRWAMVDAVSNDVDVFVRGNLPASPTGAPVDNTLVERPMLTGFQPFVGGGYVVFTTFHYHSQPDAHMIDVLSYLIFQL